MSGASGAKSLSGGAGAAPFQGRRPERARAETLLSKFRWGHTFLELNDEPLRRYAACTDSEGVVAVQSAYLADPD